MSARSGQRTTRYINQCRTTMELPEDSVTFSIYNSSLYILFALETVMFSSTSLRVLFNQVS